MSQSDHEETEDLGLRERKKRRTRETIATVALQLFSRQGYHETTIAQVAEAAEVSPRTVSAYFPAKEELVFPHEPRWFDDLEQRLAERDPDEPALEVLRAWLEAKLPEWLERNDEMRLRRLLLEREEDLRAYGNRFMTRTHELMTAAIARDLGREPEDIEPRMAAAATTAILETLGEHEDAPRPGPDELEEWRQEALRVLDQTVRFVTAGIRALERDDRRR